MNPTEIIYSSSVDLYEAWKFLVAAGLAAWLAAGVAGCGVSFNPPQISSTDWQREFNRGRQIELEHVAAKQNAGVQ